MRRSSGRADGGGRSHRRTFVAGVDGGGPDLEIVRAINDLAGALDAAVVAEGVETQAQFDEVKRMGVARVQGYLISRPLSAESIDGLVTRRPPLLIPADDAVAQPIR